MLYSLLLSVLLIASPAAPKTGSYAATKFNDAPLPGVASLEATQGFHHWVKLEQAIVRLQTNGKFTASFRYYHQHLRTNERPGKSSILSKTYTGRYSVKGTTISFAPENTGAKHRVAPFPGTIDGNQIHVRYTVTDGGVQHKLKLDLKYDPTYW